MRKVLADDPTKVVVTFTYRPDGGTDADQVALVGDFNGWSPEAEPMLRDDHGGFWIERELEVGWEHRYRFVIDGDRWETDPAADGTEPDGYGGVNSVVRTDDLGE
jgi:1,4-alpha-glucan branching enzyme